MLLRRFTTADAGLLADGLGSFAAIEKETGQMAGRFSLKPASSYGLTGGTELGYRLFPALWGRGLASEGARALIDSAFERLHLDRIVATTMAGNTDSWRVLEKCGLRRVKTFYYPDAGLMPGAEHGDFACELTRSSWTRQVNQKPAEHGQS
jgi:RimJ/RimL family protein N-acetyltransferase